MNADREPIKPTCHDSNLPPHKYPFGSVLTACNKSKLSRTTDIISIFCFSNNRVSAAL